MHLGVSLAWPRSGRCVWQAAGRVMLVVAVLLLLLLLLLLHDPSLYTTAHSHLRSQQHSGNSTAAVGSPQQKRILMWTNMWNGKSAEWERVFYRQLSGKCEVSMCELVYDHRFLDFADAVIFHAYQLNKALQLPPKRKPEQIWIFFSLEAPTALGDSYSKLKKLAGVFNWTMTYRLDSDVVVPYGRVTPITKPHNAAPVKDYWASKSLDKIAVWMVSHCGTASRREWFVKELIRYMKVDVFGKCGSKKCGMSHGINTAGTFNRDECNAVIEQYMFYFSFENAICQDYVTEKLYLPLQLDVVPVVFGGGRYEAAAPPDSFINALDFPSPEELAMYLKMVATNSTIYNKYFKWKQHYTVELGHPFSPMVCDLCSKLQNPIQLNLDNTTKSKAEATGTLLSIEGRDHTGSYPDIYSWFVSGSACRRWMHGH